MINAYMLFLQVQLFHILIQIPTFQIYQHHSIIYLPLFHTYLPSSIRNVIQHQPQLTYSFQYKMDNLNQEQYQKKSYNQLQIENNIEIQQYQHSQSITQPIDLQQYFNYFYQQEEIKQLVQKIYHQQHKQHQQHKLKLNNQIQKQLKAPQLYTKMQQLMTEQRLKMYQILRQHEFIVDHVNSSEEKQDFKSFSIQLVRHIPSWQIVELFCKYGPIGKKITIINSNKYNELDNDDEISSFKGSCSNIFKIQWIKKSYIVKRILYKGQKGQPNVFPFQTIIKEYFISLIMATLEIGPMVKNINGFDLMVYEDCIQFVMEQCYQALSQHFEHQIKLNLFKMHCLRICHSDIKFDNVMFSKSLGKMVFIDFGISQLIFHYYNQKIYTSFRGNLQFSSPQMFALYRKRSKGFINLFMNDYQVTKKLIKRYKQQYLSNQKQIKIKICQEQQNYNIKSNKKGYTKLQVYTQLINQIFAYFQFLAKQYYDAWNNRFIFKNSYQQDYFIQSIKFIIYSFGVSFKDNYFGSNLKIQEDFFGTIDRISNYEQFQSLKMFIKIFNKQTLINITSFNTDKDQFKFFIYTQAQINSFLKETNLIYNRDKALEWQLFYRNVQIKMYLNQSNFHNKKIFNLGNCLNQTNQKQQQKYTIQYLIDLITSQDKVQRQYISTNKLYLYKNIVLKILGHVSSISQRINLGLRQIISRIFIQVINKSKMKMKNSLNQEKNKQSSKCQYKPSIHHVNQYQYLTIQAFNMYLYEFLQNKDKSQIEQDKIVWNSYTSFNLLKNLILLGFNYYLFLKKYIERCIHLILINKSQRNNLYILLLKQSIQIGLLIQSTSLFLQKRDKNSKIYKDKYLNDKLLKFQIDFNRIKLQSIIQQQIIQKKLKSAQKLWIFFNRELVSYQSSNLELIQIFTEIQISLKSQFNTLSGKQKNNFYKFYQNQLNIVKDYAVNTYLSTRNSMFLNSAQIQVQNYMNHSNPFQNNVPQLQFNKKQTANIKLLDKLDYYTLTDPSYLSKYTAYVGYEQVEKCLNKIDFIIMNYNISLYIHLDIRFKILVQLKRYEVLLEALKIITSLDFNHFHQMFTYFKFTQNYISIVNQQNHPFSTTKYLQLFWKINLQFIITFVNDSKQVTKSTKQQLKKQTKQQTQSLILITCLKNQNQILQTSIRKQISNMNFQSLQSVISLNKSQQFFQQFKSYLDVIEKLHSHNLRLKIYILSIKSQLPYLTFQKKNFIIQACNIYKILLSENQFYHIKMGNLNVEYWRNFWNELKLCFFKFSKSQTLLTQYWKLRLKNIQQIVVTQIQKKLYFQESITYLKKIMQNKDEKRFIQLFYYMYVHLQFQIVFFQQKKDSNRQNILLALVVFLKFTSQNFLSQFIQKINSKQMQFRIQKYYLFFILIQQKRQYFLKNKKFTKAFFKQCGSIKELFCQLKWKMQSLRQLQINLYELIDKKGQMIDSENKMKQNKNNKGFSKLRRLIKCYNKQSFFRKQRFKQYLLQFINYNQQTNQNIIQLKRKLSDKLQISRKNLIRYVSVIILDNQNSVKLKFRYNKIYNQTTIDSLAKGNQLSVKNIVGIIQQINDNDVYNFQYNQVVKLNYNPYAKTIVEGDIFKLSGDMIEQYYKIQNKVTGEQMLLQKQGDLLERFFQKVTSNGTMYTNILNNVNPKYNLQNQELFNRQLKEFLVYLQQHEQSQIFKNYKLNKSAQLKQYLKIFNQYITTNYQL